MKSLVLIIEDEQDIRENISQFLNDNNFYTMEASNGREGINLAMRHKPDLIICDIMMPEIDGYGVLAMVQKNQDTSNIPFLFLSAKSSKDDIREGMNLGADDYLTKPFDFQDLLAAVNSRLKKNVINSKAFRQKVEEVKSTIHKTIPHEIRTPILSILGNLDILKKNIDKIDIPNAETMLSDMDIEGNRLLKLFENFILFAELQLLYSNKDELLLLRSKKTSLCKSIITTVANNIAAKYGREADLKLYLNNYEIRIVDYHFEKLIENIIDNAFKFSQEGSKVEIFSSKMNHQFVLTIKDAGRGMTIDQIENLGSYTQFNRSNYEQKGIGMGLSLCKLILDIYDGELEIKSIRSSTSIEISLNLAS